MLRAEYSEKQKRISMKIKASKITKNIKMSDNSIMQENKKWDINVIESMKKEKRKQNLKILWENIKINIKLNKIFNIKIIYFDNSIFLLLNFILKHIFFVWIIQQLLRIWIYMQSIILKTSFSFLKIHILNKRKHMIWKY